LSDRSKLRAPAEPTARVWQPAELLGARGVTGGFAPIQWRPAVRQFETQAELVAAGPADTGPWPDEAGQEDALQDLAEAQPQALPAPPAAEPEPGVSQFALEEARQQSYEEGRAAGRAQAQSELSAARQAEQQALQARLDALDAALTELGQSPEQLFEPLKRLALHLAEQLVLGELSQSPQAVERLVRRCVEELDQRRSAVVVELHPDDLALLKPWLERRAGEDSASAETVSWQLQANEHLRPGSVRASAEDAVVNDLVEHRLEALARQLLLDPQRLARQSAFQPERLAARRAEVDTVLDAQPRMAESVRGNRFGSVVEAESVVPVGTPAQDASDAGPAADSPDGQGDLP
jgi:flagellar biosynthesis/type III secretory pathway protein FliH